MLSMAGCERWSSEKHRWPVLHDHGWLALTPPDFRQAVSGRLSMRRFAAGKALYRAGDHAGGLWAIVEGSVRFETPGSPLTPGLTQVAIPGFWFGESSLIAMAARQATVYTAQSSVLATISLADCRSVLHEDPGRWQWIALLANLNRALATGLLADLLLQEPLQRIVAALLRLAGWRTSRHFSASPIALHLSQEQLGQIANLSRTVVSKTLLDLRRRGFISTGYRTLRVIDGAGLEALLEDA